MSGQKERILIVDDSREIVAGLKNFFEPAYEVLTAHNGFEGMQFFEQYEYGIDLVITDLLLPRKFSIVLSLFPVIQ